MLTTTTALGHAQQAALAALYSPAIVGDLARRGNSPAFARLARESGAPVAPVERVRDFYEAAFGLLKRRGNRHEYVYKAALAEKVLLGTHSLDTASLLTEFRVGRCKADVVILNGTSTVYEIKSERDNLDRLRDQVGAYLEVFDRVNVITGECHADAVSRLVPENVGVLILSDRYRIATRRPAASNRHRVRPLTIFESLQRAEAIRVLDLCGRAAPGGPNTRMHNALRNLFADLDPVEVHDATVAVLRQARSCAPLREFIEALPPSLHLAALSLRPCARERERIVRAVNAPMAEALTWA